VSLPLPEEADINICYMLVSHQRSENSEPHQWLKTTIMSIVNKFLSQRETGNPYEDYRSGHISGRMDGLGRGAASVDEQ